MGVAEDRMAWDLTDTSAGFEPVAQAGAAGGGNAIFLLAETPPQAIKKRHESSESNSVDPDPTDNRRPHFAFDEPLQ